MPLPTSDPLPLHAFNSTSTLSNSKLKRAMIIKLSDEVLDALLLHRSEKPSDPPMHVEFGTSSGIHVGTEFYPSNLLMESSAHELYIRPHKPSAPLRQYAAVEGKLTVSREMDSKIGNKVKSRAEAADRDAKDRKIQMLAVLPSQPGRSSGSKVSKKTQVANLMKQNSRSDMAKRQVALKESPSRVSSPISPAVHTPNTTSNDARDATRKQIIHFLALAPVASHKVFQHLGPSGSDAASRSTVSELLSSVANEDLPPKRSNPNPPERCWRLKSNFWLEVRPYEFPGWTDNERKGVARQARTVLTTLKIGESDPRWEHVKYRGSGGTDSATHHSTPTPKKGLTPRGSLSVHPHVPPVKANKPSSDLDSPSLTPANRTPTSKAGATASRMRGSSPQTPSMQNSEKARSETSLQKQQSGSTLITPQMKKSRTKESSLSVAGKLSADEPRGAIHHREHSTSKLSQEDNSSAHGNPVPHKRKRPVDDGVSDNTSKRRREEANGVPRRPRPNIIEEEEETLNGGRQKRSLAFNDEPQTRTSHSTGGGEVGAHLPADERASTSKAISSSRNRAHNGHRPMGSQDDKRGTIKSNGSSNKRRRSPIYTSSSASEAEEMRRPVSDKSGRRPPSDKPQGGEWVSNYVYGAPLPKDRRSLRRKYGTIYPMYLNLFQKRVSQRAAIERLLQEDADGEEGELDEHDLQDELELMDTSELELLARECDKMGNELVRIEEALKQKWDSDDVV